MESIETHFLSAERSSKEELKREKKIIESIEYVEEIIKALAGVVLILNKNRQTLFSNKYLLKKIGVSDKGLQIGLRPGEILKCLHSNETKGGCGTSESCRYCGAAQAISKCFNLKKIAEKECRILANVNGKITAMDLRVTANPVSIKGALYCILSISDISDEKRREILEKIFIHDIGNISGGLQGMINHLIRLNDLQDDSDFEIVKQGITDLVEGINSQRELLAAESNEIIVRKDKINSLEYLNEIINLLGNHSIAKSKNIALTNGFKHIKFISDKVLLKRVLMNMINNAIEACHTDSTIKIDLVEKNNELIFSVNNPGTISKEIQMQIFQRSFSTKGIRRGLGTYSIKLFAENYLNGKVYFISDTLSGTTFYISFPLVK